VVLAGLRLTGGGALLLFGLFAGQLVLPVLAPYFPILAWGLSPQQVHPVFAMLYVTAALAVFAQNPRHLGWLIRRVRGVMPGELEPERTPHCARCRFRIAARARSAAVSGSQIHITAPEHANR
jgi:hypothetical protein